MDFGTHWEKVYTSKPVTQVSWFQEHDRLSLDLIQQEAVPTSASIIDVGGGASTLVDDLLAWGYPHLTVLDVSGSALEAAQARLGTAAASVTWLEANILEAELPAYGYDVWHDRAAFHFLMDSAEKQAYVRKVCESLKPNGLCIIATFAEDGPTQCSGLPVTRYGERSLRAEFGDSFEVITSIRSVHHTPAGNTQNFLYCLFRRKSL